MSARNVRDKGKNKRPPGNRGPRIVHQPNIWDALDIVKRDVKQGLRRVNNIVNAELKVVSTNYTSSAVNTTPTINLVMNPAQGDDYTTRDGRSILIDHIYVNLISSRNVSASAVGTTLRVLLIRSLSGDLPAAADIFGTTTPYNASLRNFALDQMKRFSILFDKVLFMSEATPQALLSWDTAYHKHTVFDGTAAADATVGALYLVAVSNENTNTPVINGQLVARFYDN